MTRRPRLTDLRLAGLGLSLAALGRLSAESTRLVEWHRSKVLPRVAAVLQPASGAVDTTLGELGVVLLIGGCLAVIVKRRTKALGPLTFLLGAAVFSFYMSWGLAYQYPPLAVRLAPFSQLSEAASKARLLELAESSARLVSRAAARSPDFSGDSAELLRRIDAGLVEGFSRLPASIEASPIRGVRFGPVKFSRVSFAMSRLQLSGYYLPWSGEAQINAEMTRTQWPRVAAHEKAHQRGFARENEATVMGVLACLSSREPAVFYAGSLGLFVGFDRELAKADRETRRRIWALLPPRAVEDFQKEAAFWKSHEGAAGVVSEKVNDTYLKAQGVQSGVLSYGETTRLILQAIDTETLEVKALLKDSRKPEVPE